MNAQDTRLFLKSLGLAMIKAAEEMELPGDDPVAQAPSPSSMPHLTLPLTMETPFAAEQPPVAQPPGQVQAQPSITQPPGQMPAQAPGQSQAQPPADPLPPIDDTAATRAFCQELNRLNAACGGMMDVFQALFAQYLPEGGGCSKVKPEHRDAFLTQATEAAKKVALSRGISI